MTDPRAPEMQWDLWRKAQSAEALMALVVRAQLRVLPLLSGQGPAAEADPAARSRNALQTLARDWQRVTIPQDFRDQDDLYSRARALIAAARLGQDEDDCATYQDMCALRSGMSPSELLTMPLWPEGAPAWAVRFWLQIRDQLQEDASSAEPGDAALVQWYDDMLRRPR
ncbi:hypothetical protein [Roseibium aestuarii]|uniref:Uncharacterized protein n=1 Tax=Roseibium aestuarii TaxID=2600299 RepID=A0ABW4JRU4_9HYPH|nr:hypothetical protein [Roseibium aestuarii]